MPHKIDFSAVALDAHDNHVFERRGDIWTVLQADAFATPGAAANYAPRFFARRREVASVVVRQSYQDKPDGPWRLGAWLERVERTTWEQKRAAAAAKRKADSPPHKITYSAVAYNAHGNYVHEHIWGDYMNIQADGFPTPEEAASHGRDFFAANGDVASVSVCKSIQERAGGSWKPGPSVLRIERATWEEEQAGATQ